MRALLVGVLTLVALAGSGCAMTPRHVLAETALQASDFADEVAPKLRRDCVDPYAEAKAANDSARMKSLDEVCEPLIIGYEGLRATIVTTKGVLLVDGGEFDARLLELVKQLIDSGKKLFDAVQRMEGKP